jgi:hypothetical protein
MTPSSKYGAKEYNGDRPCIDPLTMAELWLRLGSGSETPKTTWVDSLVQLFRRILSL